MFENLSKEVLEKVKQAKSKEEALELLKQNGIVLSDEDLAGASGGDGCVIDFPKPPCPPDCGLICVQNCAVTCIIDEVCPQNYCSYNLGP